MIVVFGSINVDLVFAVEDLPTAGQTLLARGMRMEAGGKGANQAVAAARDGAHVGMAGAVGADSLATTALAGLRDAGIDLSCVAVVDGPTGCAAICTDHAGRNQIVVAQAANAAARSAQVPDDWLGPETILIVQMETAASETADILARARKRGARSIINLAPAAALPHDALAGADILVVNETEAAWLGEHIASGEDALALHRALGPTVIRTLGGDGVEWAVGGVQHNRAAPKVDVLDTTGAGDCFVGVLAAALDRQDPLSKALLRATAAAALSCTRVGSQISIPHGHETDLVPWLTSSIP